MAAEASERGDNVPNFNKIIVQKYIARFEIRIWHKYSLDDPLPSFVKISLFKSAGQFWKEKENCTNVP